jgi:hypothetical protein
MAAANESQGLKIAVAAFVTLTVLLAVTSYFLYSAYSRSEAQFESERDKANTAQRNATDLQNQRDDLSQKIGARAQEYDQVKVEAETFFKKNADRVTNLANSVNAAIQRAQQAGADAKELDEARARVQAIVTSYQSEPNKNFMSALDRLTELLENLTLLNTEMAANYAGLRQSLESTTSVAKVAIDEQAKAASESKADLQSEHDKHEQARQELLTKVDQLQTSNDEVRTKLANAETQLRQQKDDYDRRLELAHSMLREQRAIAELKETVLDKPDGHITFVDIDRREVHVDITRRQGARPQMQMTIFDANAPGIPTDKPKGNIMLTQVGDQYSIGRITRVNNTIEPFRVGDIVYSPAWSPDDPMQFALIGKIDVNRDGKDDRDDLKRMIEEAGGVVVYDLPPPNSGRESGKLTAKVAWYIKDDRAPLRTVYESKSDASLTAQTQFQSRYGEVVKEAHQLGIRPMSLGRLLSYLGYDMGTPVIGRTEAVNEKAMRRLLEPRKPAEKTEENTGEDAEPQP